MNLNRSKIITMRSGIKSLIGSIIGSINFKMTHGLKNWLNRNITLFKEIDHPLINERMPPSIEMLLMDFSTATSNLVII